MMKNVKKLFAALLVTAMALSTLTACGSKTETPSADASTDSDNSAATTTVDYPTKDITVVVPYGAGGTTDLCVRGVLDAVDKSVVTKNFIVSNVTGGSGLVGASQFVNAKSDGYTIGVLNCDLVLNNVLGNTDITSDQFVPLACIENDPYLFVVSKDAPYQTFEEFVDYAKAHPGEVTVADTGAGAAPHLGYLALTQDLGLDLKTVSYDSAADSVVAVVSGEVQAAITASGAAVGQMDGGNIVPLAVTSNERLSTYPDVPAMGELYTELDHGGCEGRHRSRDHLLPAGCICSRRCVRCLQGHSGGLLLPARGGDEQRGHAELRCRPAQLLRVPAEVNLTTQNGETPAFARPGLTAFSQRRTPN